MSTVFLTTPPPSASPPPPAASDTFRAQLHYWNVMGGKHLATATEPQIPEVLVNVVSGVSGLNRIPARHHHTAIRQQSYDAESHKWHTVDAAAAEALVAGAKPHYTDGEGNYNMTAGFLYHLRRESDLRRRQPGDGWHCSHCRRAGHELRHRNQWRRQRAYCLLRSPPSQSRIPPACIMTSLPVSAPLT
jgi:hypothetical protein